MGFGFRDNVRIFVEGKGPDQMRSFVEEGKLWIHWDYLDSFSYYGAASMSYHDAARLFLTRKNSRDSVTTYEARDNADEARNNADEASNISTTESN